MVITYRTNKEVNINNSSNFNYPLIIPKGARLAKIESDYSLRGRKEVLVHGYAVLSPRAVVIVSDSVRGLFEHDSTYYYIYVPNDCVEEVKENA